MSASESDIEHQGNSDTPVRLNTNVTQRTVKRLALTSRSPPTSQDGPVTQKEMRNIIEEVFAAQMDGFMNRINANIRSVLDAELKTFRKEVNDMKQSMEYMNSAFEEATRNYSIMKEKSKDLMEQNCKLNLKALHLEHRINLLEQHSRNNNVEIQCLPEKKSENLITAFENICKVIKCDIQVNQIAKITRIAKLNPNSQRPRSIVVEFINNRLRDTFLASTIQFNKTNAKDKLNTAHLGFAGPKSPVFVMQHLSAANKELHAASRHIAKEKHYKFVWIKEGKIFMRKDESSDYILVKNKDTLAALK